MKRKAPTEAQKEWHDWLAEAGARYFGEACIIHHCVGASTKHNKRWIGQDFVIPLPPRLHDNTDISLHKAPKAFAKSLGCESRKEVEKFLFNYFGRRYGLDQDLIDCIMSYSR